MAVVCEQGTCMGQCTGCGSGCASTCSSTCSGGCKNGCGSGCSSSCTGTCYTGCTGCGSGCANTCTGGCKGGCSSCGDQCSSNCTTSCSGTCSGTCSGGCGTSCSTNCDTGCNTTCTGCRGTCNTTCTGGCGAACSTNCTGSCYDECYSCGGCDNTCYGSCSGTCSNTCSDSCTGTCKNGCSSCGDQCSSNCTESCKGSCSGTCTGTCTNGCQGGCQGCSGTCEGSCTTTCTGTCSEVCADACDNGCTSNCTFNCVAVCTQSLQYTITITTQNSTATNSGVNYRASGASFSSTASAASANYFYDGWYESGSKISSAATYSFTVTGNRTLLAKSNAKTFTTTTGTSPSGLAAGTVASPPSGTIPGNVTFSITDPAPSTTNYAQGGLEKTITNYAFAGWSFTNASPSTGSSSETTKRVSVSNSVNSSNVVVSGTANFNTSGTPAVYYYCTFSAGAHGSINPNVSDWYSKNASVTLRATGDTGYEFDSWSDGSTAGDTRTVSITAPLSIQANFRAKQTFTASASVGTAAVSSLVTATVSSPSGYVGDDVTFFVDPSDDISVVTTDTAGTTETTTIYKLGSWNLIGATAIGSVTGANLEATTTSTSVSGTANFTVKSTSKRYKCTFTASSSPSGGGSVTPSGTDWYNDGQIIQVKANPTDNSWKFVSWSDGGAATHNVTIDRVKNLTATFAKKQTATVTASASISGPTVRATPASTPIYVDETSINFYADLTYSNPGTWGPGTTSRERTITNYAFSGWSYTNISGASTSNNNTSGKATSTSASALASYTQTGTEIVTQYACTFTSEDTSKGTVSSYTAPDDSPSWYTSGHSITAVATPTNQTYYAFDGWYNGGTKVSTDSSYTFTVSGSVALVAKFKDRKFTASVSASSTPADVTTQLAGAAIAGYQSSNHWIGEWVAFSTNSSVTIYSNQTTDSRLKKVYNFQNWSINGGSTASGYSASSNPCRIVSNDYTVTANANYALNTSITEYNCSFNVSPSDGGTISGASSGWYAANTRLTLTATPADSTWKFVNWTGDASGTDAQTSVVVTSNLQVGAVFAKKQTFTVSASANIPGPNTIYSPTTGPYYVEETNVTFTADPDYTNIGNWKIEGDRRVKTTTPYTFYRWTFTGATGSSSGDVNARVVTKQAAASQSTAALAGVANYTTGTPVVERQFSCSFGVDSSTKGSVTYPAPDIETGGKKWYNEGRILSIVAVPNAGYVFDHWSDNVGGGDGTREIAVDQAYSLIAVFRAVTFNINTSVGDTNIVSTYSTTSTVSYGGTAEIYASVKPSSTSISPAVNNTRTITTTNYSFTHWDITGDCTATQMAGVDPTRYSLTDIYSNISAIAYGSASTSTITQYYCVIDGTVGGTVTGDLTDWYNSGTPLSATAVPSQGYRFKRWVVTGGSVTGNTVTGTAQAGVSWLAEFELIPTYSIDYYPSDGLPATEYHDTKTENVAITLRGQTYFKNNYVQDGWARSAGGPKTFNLSANYTANQAESLYPYWVGANCNITATGYNCTVSDPGGTYAYGSVFNSRATVPSGYTFLGWWQGTDKITQELTLQITVTGDATYTARAVLSSYNVNVVNDNPDAIDSVIIHGVESTSDVVAYDGYSSIEAELKENSTEETISPDGHTKTIVNKTYGFSGWSLVGNGSLVDSTALATAIENIRGDVTATASGQKGETTNYEYTYSGSIGTPDYIDQVSSGGWVAEGGTTDYIIATPKAATEEVKYSSNNDFCYTLRTVPRFDHWTYTGSGTPTSTSADRILFSNVQSPISAVAYGAVDTYDSNRKYLCLGINGLGVTDAAASVNYVSPGSSSTFTCSLISSDYDFDGWYDGDNKLSSDQTYIHTIDSNNPAPARLTAVGKRKYPVYTTGSAEVFNSVTANPDYVYGTNESVTVTAILKTTTDTEKYTFSDWEASNGSVIFTNQTVTTTTATATATINALGAGDSVTIMATAVKANAPKYHARFQNKSINLGTVSVSKDQISKIDEQSFLPVTYKYTEPNNCHVFVGWYNEAEGGTLISSNTTYQCPVQADGSEMTLYAKVNFAYANSTIVQWGNASRTLKAFDWLVIRDFINARKRQTYNYVYNTPTNVQPGFTLTANMYNEYTTKLNIPTYEAGETITAACLDLIRDTINGVETMPYIVFSCNTTFSIHKQGGIWDGTMEYSIDDRATWTRWDGNGNITSNSNNRIYLRGKNNTYISRDLNSITTIIFDSSYTFVRCDGNIEALLDYQLVENNIHPPMASYCFAGLFESAVYLRTAPSLPATTLSPYCYANMFYGCSNLISAPALPATNLANRCYQTMFSRCDSLINAPELPARVLAEGCYEAMFINCQNLIAVPSLPATTLAPVCYEGMFMRNTSLTALPKLPATVLPTRCYQAMFFQCSNIKLSTTQTQEYLNEFRIPFSGQITSYSQDSIASMFSSTGGTFTGSPTVNTIYYTSNTIIE